MRVKNMGMLLKYGFGEVQGIDIESLFVQSFLQRIKDCYKQEWQNTLHDLSKMSVHCNFESV